MDVLELMKTLCAVPGVSGAESAAADVAAELVAPYCDSVTRSGRGSVVARLEGEGPLTVLDAHIDQIGLIITDYEENGFLRFDKCGGMDPRLLAGMEVIVYGTRPVFGIISVLPPHLTKKEDEGKVKEIRDLAIDTGLSDAELRQTVSRGDRATLKFYPKQLLNGRVATGALDDRSGVAALIRTAELLKEHNYKGNLALLFSVSEEVAGNGAATAVFDEEVAQAIAVDVSFAKQPGTQPDLTAELGKGPMIGIAPVLNRAMGERLKQAAAEAEIPVQLEIMNGRTGTHADDLVISKTGIPTALISIPQKNMHQPVEIVDPVDVENTARLMASYLLGQPVHGVSTVDSSVEFTTIAEPAGEPRVLRELCSLDGVSGREDAVRDYLIEHLPEDAEHHVDALGNLIVEKKGKRRPTHKMALFAHMDEVGLIITYITDDGTLKFHELGGIDPAVLVGRTVRLESGAAGVIGLKPIHLCKPDDLKQLPDLDDLVIDVGARNREEAEAVAELGSYAAFERDYTLFGDHNRRIKMKALDDRVGCAVMLSLLQTPLMFDTTFVFTVQEELGAIGAKTSAYAVDPDIAIILETTTAGDICGVEGGKRACLLGEGPVVSYMDRGTVYDHELYQTAFAVAEKYKLKCQTKTLVAGGNDSRSVQQAGSGARVAAISVATRYLHSPVVVLDRKDLTAMTDLTRLLLEKLGDQE